MAGVRPQVEPALVGDVGVGVERDVGRAHPPTDQVPVRIREVLFHGGQGAVAVRRLLLDRAAMLLGLTGVGDEDRTTAIAGSWLYCSKNIHWSTFARS